MLGRYEQDRILHLKTDKAHVVIVMMSGREYEGTIYDYDDEVIALNISESKGGKTIQTRHTIYRHAIEDFYTTSNVDMFDK